MYGCVIMTWGHSKSSAAVLAVFFRQLPKRESASVSPSCSARGDGVVGTTLRRLELESLPSHEGPEGTFGPLILSQPNLWERKIS